MKDFIIIHDISIYFKSVDVKSIKLTLGDHGFENEDSLSLVYQVNGTRYQEERNMLGKIMEFIKGLFKREDNDMDCYEAMGSMMINAMKMR